MGDSSAKYLHRRRPSRRVRSVMCGGLKSAGGISHCPAAAKRLRYKPDIYARYGGDDGDLPTGRSALLTTNCARDTIPPYHRSPARLRSYGRLRGYGDSALISSRIGSSAANARDAAMQRKAGAIIPPASPYPEPRQAGFRNLRAMPILKPESADPNELSCIVRHDLQSPPQGTSRKQQVIGSYRSTLAVQACAQLRRHTGIFALERQEASARTSL